MIMLRLGFPRRASARLTVRGAARSRCSLIVWCATGMIVASVPSAFARSAGDARVLTDLRQLVAAPSGPPGAIVTLSRNGPTTVLSAGVSEVGTRRTPRATDHMRIASIAKAFSGAIVLQLVQQRRLRLDDTIGRRDPGLPRSWARVTIRELLNHTSGVPNYTESDGFRRQFDTDPTRQQQRRFIPGGALSPPGPRANAAGLGLFRYRSRCGTVYGHTGNFPGYVQWAAATADGRRSVTSTLNIPAPTGALLARLRAMQADAVCALVGR